MKLQKRLSVDQMIEIERKIQEQSLEEKCKSLDKEGLLSILGLKVTDASLDIVKKNTVSSMEEQKLAYLVEAILMPKQEIINAITEYKRGFPFSDEIELVSSLAKKYGQSEKVILNRIRNIQKICSAK